MREHLAKTYPLHFQRICECIHEQHHHNPELFLDSRPCGLSGTIVWNETSEGHDYWAALARAEGYRA